MGDRIHPKDPSSPPDHHHHQEDEEQPTNQTTKPTTSGTDYIVQIPKDQIYRHPPPENARRYQKHLRRQNRRNPCCCCFCWTLGIIATLILLAAISATIFYFVVKPKIPTYSIDNLSIKGMDLQPQQQQQPPSPDLALSPEIDVLVTAENPNKKIGIYYEKGSSVAVSHSTNTLCSGTLPRFYQRAGNVTVFRAELKGGAGVKLRDLGYESLTEEQRRGKVPLGLDLRVPVRVKVGGVRSWVITVKVHCDITVDQLTVKSKIVSKVCRVRVKPW